MATGRRAERGKVSDEVTSREEGEIKKGGRHPETSEKEASNRVGRNDRLGYGWEEVEAREWGGGQLVGSG